MRSLRSNLFAVIGLAAIGASAGCGDNVTETGYAPRKLGDNATVQRGYYASPYSPDAKAAENAKPDDDLRKPGRRF